MCLIVLDTKLTYFFLLCQLLVFSCFLVIVLYNHILHKELWYSQKYFNFNFCYWFCFFGGAGAARSTQAIPASVLRDYIVTISIIWISKKVVRTYQDQGGIENIFRSFHIVHPSHSILSLFPSHIITSIICYQVCSFFFLNVAYAIIQSKSLKPILHFFLPSHPPCKQTRRHAFLKHSGAIQNNGVLGYTNSIIYLWLVNPEKGNSNYLFYLLLTNVLVKCNHSFVFIKMLIFSQLLWTIIINVFSMSLFVNKSL